MKTIHRRRDEATRLHTVRGRPNTALHVAGIALSFVAVGMGLATIVEVASTNTDTVALLVSTIVCGGLGGALVAVGRSSVVGGRDVTVARRARSGDQYDKQSDGQQPPQRC